MGFCATSLMPLLLLVLAVAACWAFAAEDHHLSAGPADACTEACSAQAAHVYGSSQGQDQTCPARRPRDRITALNLAATIVDRERVIGNSLEAAADLLGPPVRPVTGVDEVSDGIQLTLEEQREAHEDSGPRRPREETGPLLRKVEFQSVANAVSEQSVAAAQPKAPRFEPVDDMTPARVWAPVFEGCSPKFVESRCNYQQPNPQLFVTNLNELLSARSLLMGQAQLIEPLTLRQTHAQLLTMGWRSKKDPYSKASMTNDVAYGTCKAMAESTPEYITF